MTNRLSAESSPYLRQHAENPVDWYAWAPEALERAASEDRPILLSIGYSSCHWCHVMERESFEDPSVAALMNESFVNIKVDREERPDLDQIYMKAVQAMTGSGGWPMTVFLTPEGVPFYGGTYFPPEARHGMPSFSQVLRAASEAYRDRKDTIQATSERLLEAMRGAALGGVAGEANTDALDALFRTLSQQYDSTHGGFGSAPKFPQPVTLEALMRHHVRTGEPAALEMAIHTLRRMAAGGMRDHLGGGFHRYSVDARWLVPHFEKMLYDNALLARAYLDAYRLTDSDDLRAVVTEILDDLATDMRSPEGAFYAARDADSEGEEGVFYIWTPEQVEAALGPEEARLFCRVYDVSAAGNFEGQSILHLPHEMGAIANAEGLAETDLERRMAKARTTLLSRRAEREAPFRDEKIIVAWNGLAIRAFAEAGATLGRSDYVVMAEAAAEHIWSTMRVDGRLLHSAMDGEAKIPGFLDDHAALGNALLSLHGATLQRRWLEAAIWLAEEILERFRDADTGTVYDTADDAEVLIMRPRDPMDNATPSGPSLAAELLVRLGQALDEDRYREAAKEVLDREGETLLRFGPAFGRMLSVLDRILAPPVEIALVGFNDDPTRALIQAAHADFQPNSVVVGRLDEEGAAEMGLLAGRGLIDGAPSAWVCRNYACRLPVTKPSRLAEEIRGLDRS